MQHHRLSAVTVAWLRSWRVGNAAFDHVLDALTEFTTALHGQTYEHVIADIGPNAVAGEGAQQATVVPLARALVEVATVRDDEIRLVLPTAGSPDPLIPPGEFGIAALAAGEGIACGEVGLVPEVIAERMVEWRRYAIPSSDGPPLETTSVAQASEELLLATQEVIDLLGQLEISSWQRDLAPELDALRAGKRLEWLPPGYDKRSERLIAQAGITEAIAELALADRAGGAITAEQADRRETALRQIAVVARSAYRTGINGPLTL